jgi:putative transposase
VKLVSECLGVARSQLTVRIKQSVSPKVRRSRPVNDVELVAEIQQEVSELPSYGNFGFKASLMMTRWRGCVPAVRISQASIHRIAVKMSSARLLAT